MTDFLKLDIFFFITSLTVVLFTVFGVIAAVYIIRILDDLKKISQKMHQETDRIADDIETLRASAKAEGLKMKTIAGFFIELFRRHKVGKTKHED